MLKARCVTGRPVSEGMMLKILAAVGVNRHLTGDCWGSCGAHRMCDHDSGLCVPQPCGGECRYDEICEHERCVRRPTEQPWLRTEVDGGNTIPADDGGLDP